MTTIAEAGRVGTRKGDAPRDARRVWVVSELYFPEETSTGYFLTRIAEGLASEFDVRAVCGQPTHAARGVRAPYRERRNGVAIVRAPGTTLDKDVLPFRLLNMATLTASMFLHLLAGIRRGDAVLVVTTPPVLPFATWLACAIRGARCVLLVHDVYPDNAIAAGMLSADGRIARALNAMSRALYRRVECICVVGRDMRELVLRKLGPGTPARVEVIPNWADGDLHPASRGENPLLRELGLTDKFVLQYAGNMGPVHAIEDLLEAARRLDRVAPDVHLLFIGSGGKKGMLEAEARRLPNVTVLGQRPRSDQQVFLNACDVAITAFVPGMFGAGVPSRLYNVLATGKPIIAAVDAESEMALVVNEERVGWITPPGDPGRFVDAVLAARSSPGLLAEMSIRARAAAGNTYASRTIMTAFRTLFDTIFEAETRPSVQQTR